MAGSFLLGWDINAGVWRNVAVDSNGKLVTTASFSSSGAAVEDGADATIKATVFDRTTSNPLAVELVDSNGDPYVAGSPPTASTATLTNISASAVNQTALAANAARLVGSSLYNDADKKCYVKYGATATSTSFTTVLLPQQEHEVRGAYVGKIDVIWESGPTGALRCTELSA